MSSERPRNSGPSDRKTPKPKRLRRPKPAAPPRRPEETIDSAWRLSVVVPLVPEIVTFVDKTVRSLSKENWPVRWTVPGVQYLPLHQLGDVAPESADLVRMALHETIDQNQRFELRTADLGASPNIRRPKILWLGLYGPNHRLETIHEQVKQQLTELEIVVEEREFNPVITLGRVHSAPPSRLRDLPATVRQRFDLASETGEVSNKKPVALPVTELLLIRTHFGAGEAAARYEVLDHYPLLPAEPAR